MKTIDFLDAVKRRYHLKSDYQLAKFLGFDESRIAHYRAGRRFLSDETALKIAELLDLAPGYVLAVVAAERAKTAETRRAWERTAKALAGLAAVLLAGCALALAPLPYTASTAIAAPGLYIMSSLLLLLAWRAR